jgi:hypothetical protein
MEQRFFQIATEFPSKLSAESLKVKENQQVEQAQTVEDEPKQSVEGEDETKPEAKEEVKPKKADGSITQQEALKLLTEMLVPRTPPFFTFSANQSTSPTFMRRLGGKKA